VSKVSNPAWLFGSRYDTPGKDTNSQIPNQKERITTALIKMQDPMDLSPHSPISPSPLLIIGSRQ